MRTLNVNANRRVGAGSDSSSSIVGGYFWSLRRVLVILVVVPLILMVTDPYVPGGGWIRDDWDLLFIPLFRWPVMTWSPPPPHVVISMSTVGVRVDYLPRSLPTLLDQTWPVQMVILTIAKCDKAMVLKQLEGFGPFREASQEFSKLNTSTGQRAKLDVVKGSKNLYIQFVKLDWGPGTKLVGAYNLLGPRDDTVIVTVDDDCHYDPDLTEYLIRHLPRDRGAVGGLCQEPRGAKGEHGRWRRSDLVVLYRWLWHGVALECKGFLMGFGGAAYWASSFDDSVFDYLSQPGTPEGCFFHDDVWLSGYLLRKGIKRYILYRPPHPQHFDRHPNWTIATISDSMNRHQWPCVDFFDRFNG